MFVAWTALTVFIAMSATTGAAWFVLGVQPGDERHVSSAAEGFLVIAVVGVVAYASTQLYEHAWYRLEERERQRRRRL